jgi:uncharacterized protein YndB with AHSA1/START domain
VNETAQEMAPIVQSVEIRSTPDRVFGLFTNAEQLVKWWPDAATFEPRVGGKVHLVFEGRGEVSGEITRFEPPYRLGFTWVREVAPDVTTRIEVSIAEAGEGRCRVELVHSGFEAVPADQRAEWMGMHDAGWKFYLGCLADLAEGRPVDKHWT